MNYDKVFLAQLFQQPQRTVYIRLCALDLQDNIINSLEGVVSQGFISLDGKSVNRRSISLTANISQPQEIKKYIWALKTKCKIEIGLYNSIDSKYDNIIWFNQGIFILTSFSSSYTGNQIQTINLQGRDKMCMLDGSIGGVLTAGGTFDSYDYEDQKNIKYPVKQIIRDLVHQFGNEPFHNIFIYDLDIMGLELLEYHDTTPFYLWRPQNSSQYVNGSTLGEQPCYVIDEQNATTITAQLKNEDIITYENLIDLRANNADASTIFFTENGGRYKCTKIDYGDTAGYRQIELIYPDILEAKAGEPVTSILDSIIKNLLSNYEYFYDIDGHFIFQKKRSYEMEEFSAIRNDSLNGTKYVINLAEAQLEEIAYTFNDFALCTAFSENPNIANLKNDFTVWGERSGSNGDNIPIHMRYAIDNYPEAYTRIEANASDLTIYNKKYNLFVQPQSKMSFIAADTYKITNQWKERNDGQNAPYTISDLSPYKFTKQYVDWREIIWQMQADYRKFNQMDTFYNKIIQANQENNLYQNGITGYEQYYIDIEGFLHQEIYNPFMLEPYLEEAGGRLITGVYENKPYGFYIHGLTTYEIARDYYRIKCWGGGKITTASYPDDYYGVNFTYEERSRLYLNLLKAQLQTHAKKLQTALDNKPLEFYEEPWRVYDESTADFLPEPPAPEEVPTSPLFNPHPNTFWSKKVFEAPSQLNFYIDFLGGDSELMNEVGVPNIGPRPKVENNNHVKAIAYEKIPDIIYCTNGIPPAYQQRNGYSYFNVGNKIDKMFAKATQRLSAKEAIQDMVYNYAQTAEAVSITCIPIYHLEPNTKIHIDSDEYDIHDDYIIQSMTIPLTYNGTMNISATKARKRIF